MRELLYQELVGERAVYFAENLADPQVLGAAGLEAAPYERRVVKRGFLSCNGISLAGAC